MRNNFYIHSVVSRGATVCHALPCTALHYTTLYHTALHCSELDCTAQHWSTNEPLSQAWGWGRHTTVMCTAPLVQWLTLQCTDTNNHINATCNTILNVKRVLYALFYDLGTIWQSSLKFDMFSYHLLVMPLGKVVIKKFCPCKRFNF